MFVCKILFSQVLTQIPLKSSPCKYPVLEILFTFPVNYFLESSWQGKTVQVLCVVLIPTLIYLAFRKKTPPQGSGTPPTTLSGRAQNQLPVANNSSKRGLQTQPRTTSKRSVTSPTNLSSRIQTQPQVQVIKLPKADLSYIQTRVDPDLVKFPESEFGKWLSSQRENFKQWSTWASSGVKGQEGFCCQALKKCISELKEQVKKMIPVFEAHGVKKPDGGVFLQECNKAVINQKTNLLDFCMKLKGYFDALQSWDTALHDLKEKQLMEKLEDASICPHYEFTNLQTQYFHYLSLHTKEDFSRLISANITHLETFGLREMEDVDCLQLRAMQPSIERLRQLLCFLTIHGDERAHSQILSGAQEQEGLSLTQPQSKIGECVREENLHSRIEKEIEKCREVLKTSNKLSDVLKGVQDGQVLKNTVKLLNGLFDELSSNLADGLDLLKKIENNDIARQLILLKGYINQYGQKAKWEELNKNCIFRLARFAQPLDTVSTFYQMGD